MVSMTRSGVFNMLLTWVVSALAVWLGAKVIPGVQLTGFSTALVAALALGLVNSLVRPVLTALTFPITILTMGLSLLIVNAICIGVAAWLVPGFAISGFLPALLLSIVVALISSVLELALESTHAPTPRAI